MTFGELQQACVAQGIDFFMHLKAFASKVRDGKSHLVLFGFPVSKHYGEPPSEIACIDGDRLEIGNLCRHTLTMSDLTRQKSLALSSHLSSINPHVDVSANPCYLKIDSNGCISPNIGDYDIIIDTTGDDYVLELVTMGINWSKSILLSASVGLGAKRLYLFFARNIRPDFTHFLDFVTPYLIKDSVECNLAELPRNGIGCWHPLFPARADDMWMAAGTAVKALELFNLSK